MDAMKTEWKMVPVEATHEMCEAAHFGPNCAEEKLRSSDRQYWEDCYRAMLSAAPTPPNEDELVKALEFLSGMKLGMVADGIVDKALANYRARKGEQ